MGNKAYRDRHQAMGLCTKCPKPLAPNSISLCVSCLTNKLVLQRTAHYHEMQRANRRRRLNKGQCPRCANPVIPGMTSCKSCLKKYKQGKVGYNRTARAKYKSEGRCIVCGRFLEGPENVVCTMCKENHQKLEYTSLIIKGGKRNATNS